MKQRLLSLVFSIIFVFSALDAFGESTYYAKCTVGVANTGGGTVYVSTSNNSSGTYSSTSSATGNAPSTSSSANVIFYIFYKANRGYTFKGWSTNKSATSGDTSKTTVTVSATSTKEKSPTNATTYYATFSNKYTLTFDANGGTCGTSSSTVTYGSTYASGTGGWPTATKTGYVFVGWFTAATGGTQVLSTTTVSTASNHTVYARYAKLLTDKSSLSFGDVYVESPSPLNVTITHAYASTITVSVSGTNSGDFVVSSSTPVSSSTTEASKTITLTFTPSASGTRSASLTIHSSYSGLSDVVIPLSGTGKKYDQTLSWTTIEENMLLGGTQTIVATASSGLTPTYTSGTTSVISVSGSALSADAEGSSVITASQAGNYKYNAATPITKTVNVFNKEVPEFSPSFAGTTCGLLVDGTATITLDNVSDGLSGDFTAVAADATVVSVTRSGNTLTITGLKQGSTTVTLHQNETSGIFATDPDPVYTFNVSRVTNTLAVTATSKDMKVDEVWSAVATTNSNATIETSSTKSTVATYNVSTNAITAHNEGSADIIIRQAQTVKYTAAACTIRVNVTKYDNTLAVAATSYPKKVDDAWSCAVSSINSDAAISVTTNTTTDSLTATYNSSTKAIDLNVLNAGTYSVTLSQPATYKFTATTKTITVTATKYANAITVSTGGSVITSEDLTWGDVLAVALSATNTDYEGSPLSIEQTAGSGSGIYTPKTGVAGSILALPTNGTARWTVSQEATYKYEAAETTFSINSAGVAANPCYLLQQDAERGLNTIENGPAMEIASGVKGKLSFEARKTWLGLKNLFVQYSTNGGTNWVDLAEISVGTDYEKFEYDIEQSATHIRFLTRTGATLSKYYKNVRIPRVTYFNASTDWIAMSPTVETQKTKKFTLSYSECDWGNINIVSDNPLFTVSPSSISVSGGRYGTQEITVTCSEDATPSDVGNIVMFNKAQKCSVEVRVSRPEPAITWNPYGNAYFVNTEISNICISENTDYENCPLSYSSSDESVAYVDEDGVLHILGKKKPVTITVSQGENEDFLATSQTFTFTPIDMPDLAVPFVMTKGIYDGGIKSGSNSWNSGDNAVLLGEDKVSALFSWNSSYIVIMFHGTPDKLSFKYKNSTISTGVSFIVQESTNGVDWTGVWNNSELHPSYTESGEIQLQPNTLYLKFFFIGNFAGFFKDIKVTELIGDYYMQDEESGEYLSRGAANSVRAVMDEYGAPVRVTRETSNNSTFYTHYQFYDSRKYLYINAAEHNIFTNHDATTYGHWTALEQSDGRYVVQSNGVYSATNGQYLYNNNGVVALTTDADRATHWTLEHADQHPAAMAVLKDAQATAATEGSTDFGADVTWAKLNEAMANFDFVPTILPTTSVTEKNNVQSANGTTPVYENTIEGLEPGLYRLTLEACYRPSSDAIASENHGVAGHENILAYMFANEQKTQLHSVYDYSPAPTTTSEATTEFDAGRYKNYIFVKVVADDGETTGSVHYGICKPSWVSGDWLCYRNFTLERITRKEFILDGHGTEETTSEWHTDGNWSDEEQPGSENWAVVRHDAVINTPVSVYGVRIENDAVLNVAPTGGLTVGAGGVVGATAENLVLRAATTGEEKGQTGFLRINPAYTGEMPTARVELYSVGYYDASRGEDNSAAWQYVGSPVTPASTVTLEHTYYGSWVYKWDEQTAEWTTTGNNGRMQPFEGYCTTQKKNADGMMHEYEGQLTSNQTDIIVNLSYHAGHADSQDDGFNLLANSFSAPIDLTQFRTTDFVGGVEPTVYLYNTGSKAQWLALQQDGTLFTQDRGTTAGQYVAVPVGDGATLAALITASSGAVPAVIPPMQGFRVNATGEGATLKLSYNRLVWQGNYTAYGNRPMRVVSSERSEKAEQEMIAEETEERADTVIQSVALTLSADGYADRLYLLQSDIYTSDYDRGADAWQINGGMFNLFARSSDNDGRLAVCAADDLSGMQVGIRCDRQRLFTLSCTYATVENLALRDLVTGDLLPLAAGAVYQLQYNDLGGEPRFIIEKMENTGSTEQTDVTTSLDAARQQQQNVRIYDVTGKLLRSSKQSDINTMLPAGVYLLQQDNECKKVVRL